MIGYLRDVLRVLRAPCREHAPLLSKQLDADLRPGIAAGLRLHVLYCTGCRRYRAQIRQLREMTRTLGRETDSGAATPMPSEVRERILRCALGDSK